VALVSLAGRGISVGALDGEGPSLACARISHAEAWGRTARGARNVAEGEDGCLRRSSAWFCHGRVASKRGKLHLGTGTGSRKRREMEAVALAARLGWDWQSPSIWRRLSAVR
jgi:hypothetical protein